ncbi:hypothetical protein DITRI_Ditri17bG0003700 [Diplodiscus trichospermus]
MLCSDRKKAIKELGQGRELTNQLRDLLSKSVGEDGLVGSEDLVMKIFNSFANTLSLLRNKDEVSQNPNTTNNNMNKSWDIYRKSEALEESINKSRTTPRGCLKRRKCAEDHSRIRTRDTATLIDDGCEWRKYGQKVIKDANHPRNYFRCTHKTDQGCKATKHVQKIEDNPPKYRTIYYGHHTCNKNLLNSSDDQLILDDSTSNNDSSMLISFANTNQHDNPFLSSFPSTKQEIKEDHAPTHDDITYNGSSSSDYLFLPDDQLRALESLADQMTVSSADHSMEDVISGMLDSVDLDQLFEF